MERDSAPVLLGGDFEPVETVGAQKHEMDHRGQKEQERALSHENATRVEDQPDLVEFIPLTFQKPKFLVGYDVEIV